MKKSQQKPAYMFCVYPALYSADPFGMCGIVILISSLKSIRMNCTDAQMPIKGKHSDGYS